MQPVIRAMTRADISEGMRLKQQAGWNQVEADWERVLALQPDGCFLAECEGETVGTVTTCLFGEVAWVAMMLVAPARRGQGIGRALMSHALEFLDDAGTRSVRLDATPLGQPLYQSMGFEVEHQVLRYQGQPQASRKGEGDSTTVLDQGEVEAIIALDHRITATNRSKLLERLVHEEAVAVHVRRQQGVLTGFMMIRPGANAYQVGPCLGPGEAGRTLLKTALTARAGELTVVDIPEVHRESRSVAQSHGLEPVRQFARMGRGVPVLESLEELWAGFGAEMG